MIGPSLYNFQGLSYRGRFFSDDSCWNSAIMNDAVTRQFVDAGKYSVGLTSWDVRYGSIAVYSSGKDDPTLPVRWLPESWQPVADGTALRTGNSAGREAQLAAQSRDINAYPGNTYSTQRDGQFWYDGGLPAQYDVWAQTGPLRATIPSSATPAPDSDGNTAILQPDGRALELYSPIRLSDGTWLSQMYSFTDAYDGLGTGTANGRRASMIPNYAGLLTDDDLRAGHIDHALALVVPGSMLARSFTGPALAFDSNSSDYGGAIAMGTRLFLPGGIDLGKLGLKSGLGRMVAEAAQDHGMYVVDRGGGGISIVAQTDPQSPELVHWNWDVQQDLDTIFKAAAIHQAAEAVGRMPAATYAGLWSDGAAIAGKLRFATGKIGEENFRMALNESGWKLSDKLVVAPAAWHPESATHLAWVGYADVQINLAAAQQRSLALEILGAQRGGVLTGGGDDHVTVLSQNNGKSGHTAIRTGAGDDVVRVTAAGLSIHDEAPGLSFGALWDAGYDGRRSTFYVELGDGDDHFYADGLATVVVLGGPGDDHIRGGSGQDRIRGGSGKDTMIGGDGADTFIFHRGSGRDTVLDFTPGTDKLELHGYAPSAVKVEMAVQNGVAGLLIGLGATNDIFLPHVKALDTGDMVFIA